MTEIIKGGGFLIEEADVNRVFTPEDFSDEHKMIAKTTEDYITNEVLPYVDNLENHELEKRNKNERKQIRSSRFFPTVSSNEPFKRGVSWRWGMA